MNILLDYYDFISYYMFYYWRSMVPGVSLGLTLLVIFVIFGLSLPRKERT